MKRIVLDFLLASAFLSTIFGYTMSVFAPEAWAHLLRLLGL